jgi:UDP-N-acetylmuramoyl-tripeptide--D-alanyl-D-alanine ligase
MVSLEMLYSVYRKNPSVQTDTRQLRPGDLFFALKGEHFNGNRFAQQALDAGAAFAVVDEAVEQAAEDKLLRVDNVLESLQALAKFHRQQFQIPFLAITGSNGKTTTKELIHAVLSTTKKTYTTRGNLNNHIGIPLTILGVAPDAEMAVIEMGANHLHEIEGYCAYCLPTHGLVTNIGKAHLEGFGGEEGVRKGKGELYDFLRQNHGTAFVLWDDETLRTMSRGISHRVGYGTRNTALTGQAVPGDSLLRVAILSGLPAAEYRTQLVGDYNLPNVLAAACIGMHFDIPPGLIRQAIENYAPANSRSQLLKRGNNRIILDAYNANPSSMQAAIEHFASLAEKNKILVLGAMAELGPESPGEHQRIIDLIAKYPWKEVILVGGDFLRISHPYRQFENSEEAKKWFRGQDFQNDYFLLKGSRNLRMEKVIEE